MRTAVAADSLSSAVSSHIRQRAKDHPTSTVIARELEALETIEVADRGFSDQLAGLLRHTARLAADIVRR